MEKESGHYLQKAVTEAAENFRACAETVHGGVSVVAEHLELAVSDFIERQISSILRVIIRTVDSILPYRKYGKGI